MGNNTEKSAAPARTTTAQPPQEEELETLLSAMQRGISNVENQHSDIIIDLDSKLGHQICIPILKAWLSERESAASNPAHDHDFWLVTDADDVEPTYFCRVKGCKATARAASSPAEDFSAYVMDLRQIASHDLAQRDVARLLAIADALATKERKAHE